MSVEAIITELEIPTSVSVPHLIKRFSKKAREALPENGLKRSNGKISAGMPIFSKAGQSSSEIFLVNPEPRSILTETISAHIEGRRENAPFAPFFAPSKKQAK